MRFAPLINIALLLLSVWMGYSSLEPNALPDTNPDKYLSMALLVVMPVFAFGAVSIFGAGHNALRRPSWRRFAISWWRDPLQCLFLTTCSIGGVALGAAMHLPGTSARGFWMFMASFSMFIGLVVGQAIAYAYHRAKITKA